ncbi:MAG TPA: hypothetical protein VF412_04275 [Bdellovibrio sp.]|uniref:hypothetical protein n=1 Tax=Bdellovibrio sp. TaxID=28201 RepID=UPI002F0CEE6F
MKIRISIVLLGCFLSIQTQAADNAQTCSTTDLSKSPGLEAPINRDGTGWCYAYSAADLVSFKMKQRVSAFDIAANFHEMIRTSIIKRFTHVKTQNIIDSGGNIDEALESVSGKAVCSEKELPSDYNNNDLQKYLRKVMALPGKQEDAASCAAISKAYPTILSKDIKGILEAYGGDRRIIELAKASCKHRIQVSDLKFHTEKIKNQDISILDTQLDKGNIVSFEHDPGFFFLGPNYNPDKKIYDHQATIVGRRFKDGQCQYLVKGSSGRDKNYKYAAPYKDNNTGGYVWVDKDTIAKFTGSMTYVE